MSALKTCKLTSNHLVCALVPGLVCVLPDHDGEVADAQQTGACAAAEHAIVADTEEERGAHPETGGYTHKARRNLFLDAVASQVLAPVTG